MAKQERDSEFVVTYRGRYIYDCGRCGTSNGGNLNNISAGQKLIKCNGCNYGLKLSATINIWREYQRNTGKNLGITVES